MIAANTCPRSSGGVLHGPPSCAETGEPPHPREHTEILSSVAAICAATSDKAPRPLTCPIGYPGLVAFLDHPNRKVSWSRLNLEQSAKVFSKCSRKCLTLVDVGGWQAVRQRILGTVRFKGFRCYDGNLLLVLRRTPCRGLGNPQCQGRHAHRSISLVTKDLPLGDHPLGVRPDPSSTADGPRSIRNDRAKVVEIGPAIAAHLACDLLRLGRAVVVCSNLRATRVESGNTILMATFEAVLGRSLPALGSISRP